MVECVTVWDTVKEAEEETLKEGVAWLVVAMGVIEGDLDGVKVGVVVRVDAGEEGKGEREIEILVVEQRVAKVDGVREDLIVVGREEVVDRKVAEGDKEGDELAELEPDGVKVTNGDGQLLVEGNPPGVAVTAGEGPAGAVKYQYPPAVPTLGLEDPSITT